MSSARINKQIFSNGGSYISTTIASGSNGVTLPRGTLNVVSTSGFPSSGTLSVQVILNGSYALQTLEYTGLNSTQFTGVTGGSGLLQTGQYVVLSGSVFSGTWTCPAGVKYVIVTGCGGGGGGGSGASSSGKDRVVFAGGGSGGHAAPTITQIVQVTPGVVYNVSIGMGGVGGTTNCVANVVNGGGARPGNPGSDGSSSIFGSVVFPGGKGGREGALLSINSLTFMAGRDCANNALDVNINPTPQNIQLLAERAPFTAATSLQGAAHVMKRRSDPNQYSIAGGGTAGGTSNNVNSKAGDGGQGAQGWNGYPFAGGGGSGFYGAGGGGGGGGENWDYNNTHDGAPGGWGGAGFVEIAWVA